MKVVINTKLCCREGVCEQICPEVFELGRSGISRVVIQPVEPEVAERVRLAAWSCPSGAILIEDDDQS